MTQKSYFSGHYVGCDAETGLGLPQWHKLFESFNIPVVTLDSHDPFNNEFLTKINFEGPQAFIVPIDPEQTYYPKITSTLKTDGTIKSNPLHMMTPELSEDLNLKVLKYV
jgi:acetolactate synthase-1/2/3 large subunit